MAKIAVIDDDLSSDMLVQRLRVGGNDVTRYASMEEAENKLGDISLCDLIILDIIMPWPNNKPQTGLTTSSTAGLELLHQIRARRTTIPVIVYSAMQDRSIEEAISDEAHTTFVPKWENSLKDFVRLVQAKLGIKHTNPGPLCFIVHGRNDAVKLELKNYLQNTLKLPEPIILHEQPNLGRTIIEKFEDYSSSTSVAFVLLTPDDVASPADAPNDTKRRARQNVIYEMGYFHGYFGRESGRIILLHKGPLELPTDIAGVIYIDITNGIDSAGEQIRKELEHVAKLER